MPRPDRHEEIEINYLNEGSLVYNLGGRQIRLEPRRLTMFWAALPHQIVSFKGVASYFVVTIPFDRFLQWGLPESVQSHLLVGDAIACTDPQQSQIDAILLERWRTDLNHADEQTHRIVLLELQARMMRLSQSAPLGLPPVGDDDSAVRPKPQASTLEKAERMACFIAKNYKRAIPIADIAASVDLHPDYAATVFRKSFGVTINAQVTRHRVADVQSKLLSTDQPIIDIAYGAGFESLSSFNRTFRTSTGMTPRAFRKQFRR